MPPSERPLAQGALGWLIERAVRIRLVVAPVFGSFALTFAFFEPTFWRRAVAVCGMSVIFALSFVEWVRYRRYAGTVHLPVNILLTVLGQLLMVTATGGMFSPVLPLLVPMNIVAALFGALSTVLAVLALAVPWMLTLSYVHATDTLLPVLYGGPQPLEHGPAPWIAAFTMTVLLGLSGRVGLALHGVFEAQFREATEERDRSLALHAEQSRALTLLTSEIAHELKNPLASIKGLGALVAKDVEGRTAERLAVLRGEVDRMQGILDEFLNLSRPLVPLVLAETDLRELCREVLRLHEGSALERGVRMELAGEPAPLRCDPRKLRQVLINLVQNALHASPRGGRVLVRLEPGEPTHVQVIDQGPGLPPELLERVFEPGVTDKEHGSGIGLVVARSLARQHGGDVDLHRNDGEGLTAQLTLPRTARVEPGVSP